MSKPYCERPHKTTFRVPAAFQAIGLSALSTLSACASVTDSKEVSATETQLLAKKAGTTLWNDNVYGLGASIDVCFTVRPITDNAGFVIDSCPAQDSRDKDCYGALLTDGAGHVITDALRSTIRRQVEAWWVRYGNISLNWLGDCPTAPFSDVHRYADIQDKIAIQFADYDHSNLGKTSGKPTLIEYNWRGIRDGFTFNVLHEFGHALGFEHEWYRSDFVDPPADDWLRIHGACRTDSDCTAVDAATGITGPGGTCATSGPRAGRCVCDSAHGQEYGETNSVRFTSFPDFGSIMNYCHTTRTVEQDKNAELTRGDIVGLATAYGNKPIGPEGHRLDYFRCALEGDVCAGGSGRYVAFGAGGKYVYSDRLTGQFACDSSSFGDVDPAPGTPKACYVASYSRQGSEGASVVAIDVREVAYGANGVFNFKTVGPRYDCDNATFGDPLYGVPKACYQAVPDYLPFANEGATMAGLVDTPVAYGANGKFIFKVLNGSAKCAASTFGFSPSSAPKKCYKLSATQLAEEGQLLNFPSNTRVWFGSGFNGLFTTHYVGGAEECSPAFFGDPDFGHVKHCYK